LRLLLEPAERAGALAQSQPGDIGREQFLTGRICTPYNVKFGETIDREVVRTGHVGVIRQVLGIEGRANHERKNVFEYKASQTEPPVQLFRVEEDGNLKPVFQERGATKS